MSIAVYTDTRAHLAAVATSAIAAGDLAMVSGGLVADDAQGGIFTWSPGSMLNADDPNVIKPIAISGAGRWVRIRNEVEIDARDYGVRADTGTDQSAAIQAAIDASANGLAINAGVRKRVILPPGVITVANPIVIRPLMALAGSAWRGTKLLHAAGVSTPMFVLDAGPVSYFEISNMELEGNGSDDEHCFYLEATPVAGVGGAWNSAFENLLVHKFGGKGFWFRGGALLTSSTGAIDCPHQFITLKDVTVFRKSSATSRALSLTGKCGQFYFVGACQFDSANDGKVSAGLNVCFGREFKNTSGTGSAFGDAGDAIDLATRQLKTGWGATPIPGTNPVQLTDEQCYQIDFSATVQGAYHGIWIDRGSVLVRQCYFEQIWRSVLVFNAIVTVEGCEARNAGHLAGASDGWFVANMFGHVRYGGNSILSDTDNSYRRLLDQASYFQTKPDLVAPNAEALPSGTVRTVTVVHGSNDALDIGSGKSLLVTPASASNGLEVITSNHSPGTRVTLRCNGDMLQLFGTQISAPEIVAGRSLVLRDGDAVVLERVDNDSRPWLVVSRAIAPLARTAMPSAGYFLAGEFVRNLGSSAYTVSAGRVVSGWVRAIAGTGHILGTDWIETYANA